MASRFTVEPGDGATLARSVARFTATSATPGTARIDRSTLATQDAQLIPSMSKATLSFIAAGKPSRRE